MSPSPESGEIISALAAAGGWGLGEFRIDFSLHVLDSDEDLPLREFEPVHEDFFVPDCDHVPFPVPATGAVEGHDDYVCSEGGDCHLIVIDRRRDELYEMWRADLGGGLFRGGCAVVWDLSARYDSTLRGLGCTSADAAGLPIAPLTASADEVAAGEVRHALRFILPNNRIRRGIYVPPATHSTQATRGGPSAPPYGVRFRLRADYPLEELPSDGARVIARALQRYGMILADGGQVALTLQSDRFARARWSDLGVDSRSLRALAVEDFEVVDLGEPVDWLADTTCRRN
jgi:hypothetical protein